MARIRKNVALIIAVILAVTMTGCKKDKKETESSTVAQIKNSDNAAPSNVEIKNYEFPEFLNDLKAPMSFQDRYIQALINQNTLPKLKNSPLMIINAKIYLQISFILSDRANFLDC